MNDIKETKKVLAFVKLVAPLVSFLLIGGIIGYALGALL